MQVNNTLNSMMQLSKQLDKSANELSKLNANSQNTLSNGQQNTTLNQQIENKSVSEPDLVKEMVNQIQIPIAYNANAEVIATQDATTQTLLDIKA